MRARGPDTKTATMRLKKPIEGARRSARRPSVPSSFRVNVVEPRQPRARCRKDQRGAGPVRRRRTLRPLE